MISPQRLRRFRISLILFALTAAALAWSAIRPAPGSESTAPRPPNGIALADVDPWGANFFLDLEVEAWSQQKTVREARAAGIRWAKQMIPWYDVEPEQGDFRFDKYDRIIDLYRAEGMEVIARLDFPPAWVEPAPWAPQGKRGPPNNVPPADFSLYATYVSRVVDHFGARVGHYQIWNEPNLTYEWGYGKADPKAYARLLAAAASAARTVNPDVVILSAPMAINTETVDLVGNLSDLEYLRQLYDIAGFEDSFDVLSVNAFGKSRPPEEAPAADRLNFQRMALAHDIMETAGDGCKAVWAAEYGWNSAPEGIDSIWDRVSPEDQARYTLDGVSLAQSRWPWAGVFNLWYFRHCCQSPDEAVTYFQLLDAAFSPRRVYTALREAAATRPTATAGYWAERSAPVTLADSAAWLWKWDAPPGSRDCDRGPEDPSGTLDHRYLENAHADARLSFSFRGTAAAVRVRRGPQAGTLTWRVDGRPGEQRAALTGQPEWAWVILASGLDGREHTVDLGVGTAGGSVAIDGYRVDTDAAARSFGGWRTVGALVLVFLAGLLVIDGRHVLGRLPRSKPSA
ncbi:MAG TPA: beta-galactosidase [Anaerolineae bacterium]|nr:beta-galactosidase [Anaerolineae bacterium]